jgi:diguanylate cyclase (GGDEF)-like protein
MAAPYRKPEHTTAFVTMPIAFLGVAAFLVALGSLIIGAQESDRIALAHQRATIEHALEQHGHALERELKVQTVWNEGYEKTIARDQAWMRAFLGEYLSQLFGYDRIYVLSDRDELVFGFVDGHDENGAEFRKVAPVLQDLVAAARKPDAVPASYQVATTSIDLGAGQSVEHRTVSDVRSIQGKPATVVVSTIVPDRLPGVSVRSPPFLLVAVEDLDKSFTGQIGATFGFRELKWVEGAPPEDHSAELVKSLNGATVGTLAWRKEQPGWEFVRRLTPGLALALLLLGALAAFLIRWGRGRARQLLESEEEARQAARTDALTGLPNRVALREQFPLLIDRVKRHASTLGVLAVDLDQFKEINDDFGHAAGDEVLLCVAKRLQGLLGPQTTLARADGDEFNILALGIGAEGVALLAGRITAAVAEPITVSTGTKIFVTASVGHALAPRDGESSDDLVRRAELALTKAKERGGGLAVAFAPEMDLELSHRRALESALRTGVANDAIDVVYQPIMDPTGCRVLAVEALARWEDPLLGSISPEVFVPLAEETGLIPKIGEIVLRRAIADAMAWPEIEVAVNVSGAQIHHGDIVGSVRDALAASEFPPQRLVIEITESVLLVDERRANEQIRGLQRMGVKVALDDFGSGYSSLLYLRKFGFDKLKLDRSFIDEIGRSKDSTLILASIIRLGLDLRLGITAEGIETTRQHRWLKASGCHQLQGYLFSRPLTAEQMTAFLATHRTAATG